MNKADANRGFAALRRQARRDQKKPVADQWRDLALDMARHLRNTDDVHITKWGVMAGNLLLRAAELDPRLYEARVIAPKKKPATNRAGAIAGRGNTKPKPVRRGTAPPSKRGRPAAIVNGNAAEDEDY